VAAAAAGPTQFPEAAALDGLEVVIRARTSVVLRLASLQSALHGLLLPLDVMSNVDQQLQNLRFICAPSMTAPFQASNLVGPPTADGFEAWWPSALRSERIRSAAHDQYHR
jgi:hypothetical protein